MSLTTTGAPLIKPCPGDKCLFEGLVLPLFGTSEMEWPNALRLILYLVGLGWTFLGIAIISDVFMAGIEKVTSWKKRVKDKKTGKTITVYVWNATVANLTLMALGSSAPEILLSLIEIASDELFSGPLGAGTIVGSAAFNLLVISAVCVAAFPDSSIRYIKQTTVYAITASSSVFAYLWLLLILQVISPNVCEAWEAVVTLMFCPMLVVLAYLADRGYFDRGETEEKEPIMAVPEDVSPEELAIMEDQIRKQHPGVELTGDQVCEIMVSKYFGNKSRAYYRHAGMQKASGKKVEAAPQNKSSMISSMQGIPTGGGGETRVEELLDTYDSLDEEKRLRSVSIGFESARYAFLENCGHASVVLVRTGSTHLKATVAYATRDGSAKAGEGETGGDYRKSEGIIVFEKEETKKTLKIEVFDDDAFEENEEFYVDLSNPTIDDDQGLKCTANLAKISSVTVVVIDDDDPGTLRFINEEVEVQEEAGNVNAIVEVERVGGAAGTISCKFSTENMSAIGSMDYEDKSGTLDFAPTVQKASIAIPIFATGRYQKTASFIVRLTDPKGCCFDKKTDGGEECCICNVTIKGKSDPGRANMLKMMGSKVQSQQAILGNKKWRKQFYDALFTVVEDEEDEDGGEEATPASPSVLDYFMHIVALPWKLLFACVPPVDYCGGWACFFGALLMIAVVTAIVGDMANLVGCCLKIQPEITAITFVALGTSLPDTFASKSAAEMDPHADASIGNITGSNSVNVFIGLGLSWSIAAIFWESSAPTEEWLKRVTIPGGVYYDIREDIAKVVREGKAVFVVPAGSLWFNLMVFSTNAFFALQHLFARRKKFGGELGGPLWGFMGQYFSAAFLSFQWVLYITASSVFATMNKEECA